MVTALLATIYGLFGLIIGSFLNVVILRHGARGIGGRSGCLSCGAPLSFYDLIPVVSWLYLRGRCRQCGSGISAQYPLVEILTMCLFAVIGISPLSLLSTIFALVVVSFLVLITVYDLRHTIIPDEWSYTLACITLLSSLTFVLQHDGVSGIIPLLVAGPVTALPLFLLWLISKGQWMGLGDAKLALSMGWLLGLQGGLLAIFASFVVGAVISVFILLPLPYIIRFIGITHLGAKRVGFTMKSEIPFGPFLVLGCFGVWFLMIFGYDVSMMNFFQL